MPSFVLRAVVEQDEEAWRAYIPALEAQGAATWGKTRDEALRNLQEVAQMVIEELRADGLALPAGVEESNEPRVAVCL